MKNPLTQILNTQFPDFLFKDDRESLEIYGKDWTESHSPDPSLIFFPRTSKEISEFLKFASENNLTVVPSGGRTGLSGGAVAANKELVISLEKMRKIEAPCLLSKTVRVEAGVITDSLQESLKAYGLCWPVDFASSGSSQIGGNIATNAGGMNVIKNGMVRNWVSSIEVILISGEIYEFGRGLLKNNAGFDLMNLFIGSEGCLGIISKATLKLDSIAVDKSILVLGSENIKNALSVLGSMRKNHLPVRRAEILSNNCLQKVKENFPRAKKLGFVSNFYTIFEVADSEALNSWTENSFDVNEFSKSIISDNPKEIREIWILRENISESLRKSGSVFKYDISFQLKDLPQALKEIEDILLEFNKKEQLFFFGHLGDGNIHINILDESKETGFLQNCKSFDEKVYSVVKKYKGSVAAEHGIGLGKKEALEFSYSQSEINLMREIKHLFDPENLLNPGKIF